MKYRKQHSEEKHLGYKIPVNHHQQHGKDAICGSLISG
jgi:hypothetical protein